MAYFLAVLSNVGKDLRWTNDFEKKAAFYFFKAFEFSLINVAIVYATAFHWRKTLQEKQLRNVKIKRGET